MNPVDIQTVIQWWLVLFILGIGFLPVTVLLFKPFFDKGYIFAKIIGMGLVTYVLFVLGVLHLVPFRTETITLIFLALIVTCLLITKKHISLTLFIRQHWGIILLEEGLFFTALFTWTYIHGFAPDIHGLEKCMDYGFINSIIRSDYFPPKDMWFTPLFINYYYFGHLMTAMVTKLSFLQPQLTFNLMLATIFALCFTQTFSIGANLFTFMKQHGTISRIKRVIAGFLTAAVVTIGGNLHILYAFFKPYDTENPRPLWELSFLPLNFPNGYWYPNATRYIYNTIHEFPMYSWVVADLHGHVLDIPFVLLVVAALLSLFFTNSEHRGLKTGNGLQKQQNTKSLRLLFLPAFRNLSSAFCLLFLGFLLAIMYMTNAWDGAIYLLLAVIILFFLSRYKSQHLSGFTLSVCLIFLSFILFAFPYNFSYTPSAVSGIGVLCAPDFLINLGKFGPFLFEKDHCQHSYWWELLMLYGFFYFFVLCFLAFVIHTKKQLLKSDYFILLLILLGTLLIIIPEFVYLKDIYPAHYRANTMFKLVFQAFILLGISSMYILFRLGEKGTLGKLTRSPFIIMSILLLTAIMQYPKIAVNSYYGELKEYKGLDGTIYLKTLYPTDYEAILWLNKKVKGQPVILEAQGDSYTDYARVSANTGLPTILGWTVHEWLWRGSYAVPAPRIEEIKTIYETQDLAKAKSLLQKYDVNYIFIGSMEYQKYPNLSEEKFKAVGKLIFMKGTTKIYELRE